MGPMRSFCLFNEKQGFTPIEIADIYNIIRNYTLVGFNTKNYDEPMLKMALAGANTRMLKFVNDRIILGRLKRWDFADEFPMALKWIDGLDSIDIMEPTPGVKIGLKTYMARMHAPTIQDLPYDPADILTFDMACNIDAYCGNDLKGTRQLRDIVMPRLQLREQLSVRYDVDLRSKSDAQMSEAIIAARLGYRPQVPFIPTGHTFKLIPAPWVQFVTPALQEVHRICCSCTFSWSRNEDGDPIEMPDGSKIKTGVNMPAELKALRPKIGNTVYKFGIGGIHSTESAQTYYSIPGVQSISDHDVGSYYPSLLILLKLLPPEIQRIYEEIYHERLDAKADGGKLKKFILSLVKDESLAKEFLTQPMSSALRQALSKFVDPADIDKFAQANTIADGLKIVLNGAYGKLWSKYSFLCNPEAGIAITINGQLLFLMLAERLELGGVRVISANTDGIVLLTPTGLEWYRDATLQWFEQLTGLTTEATEYASIHSRDVNSYIAVKPDGNVKRKGVFSESGVLASMQGVHPDRDICKDAAIAFVTRKIPVLDTIKACTDIRKFVLAKSVQGGGHWRGTHLGKTVRWYYCTTGEAIRYIKNGNKVAGSDGAQPIQVLPDQLPADIDYAKYEEYALKLLRVSGVIA